MKNPAAVALAALAKGKPKNLSKAERRRRRKVMQQLNEKRQQNAKAKAH